MLHAGQHGTAHAVTGFTVQLLGATQYEQLDDVVSFVGEDGSGSFGLMKGHARFVTTLVFGLARVRYAHGGWEYLALPGAVAYFERDNLRLSARRFLRSNDYTHISKVLREEFVQEERTLLEFRRSLAQMEQAMLVRLWRIGRGEEIKL